MCATSNIGMSEKEGEREKALMDANISIFLNKCSFMVAQVNEKNEAKANTVES